MDQSRPNILYLHSHDTGRYVRPYGHAIDTPNIQRLAEEGIVFRQAFSAAPTCSPSRASLLTGQYPHSNGMLGLAHRGFELNNYDHHLVHTLKEKANYHTVLLGEEHVAKDFARVEYDEIVEVDDFYARTLAPKAVELLHTWSGQQSMQPFFLAIGFQETHRDYPDTSSLKKANYILPPAPLPDTPETRLDMLAYHTSAKDLDVGIGRILDALEHTGLAENTLIICTTDHGIAFPGMKGSLTDHGIGVMLIMRGPGGFRDGKVCDAMVSQIDIFPTLCELLDIPAPDWLQGESFLPVVRGERESVRDEIFAEVTYHAAYEPKRALRTKRWKYMRRFDGFPTVVLPNVDDGVSKTLLLEHGWGAQEVAEEELYDLVFDPHEVNNLARDERYSPVLRELRSRLTVWMRESKDALLEGPIEAPVGVELNRQGQRSAGEETYVVDSVPEHLSRAPSKR